MNVGILTYHWVSNFGANLQTLSTYKYVENSGNNPIIINWVPEDVKSYYDRTVSSEQNEAHAKFGKRWYKHITAECHNSEEIAKEIDNNEIDLVLIGSDAVFTMTPWLGRFAICKRGIIYNRPLSNFAFPNPFYGDFLGYVKRPIKIVAISASAQNTYYKKIIFPKEKRDITTALKRFSRISVRDIWTQKMLSFVSNKSLQPEVTPDPVFGFNNNVRPILRNYVRETLGITGKYVLLSVASTVKDMQWILELESIFKNNDITVVGLPKTLNKQYKSPLKYNISFPIDPLDWYASIAKSSGYIGELMHPILVSLHNCIPVYVFDTYGFNKGGTLDKESSKTYQIINKFGFNDNYYNPLLNDMPRPETVLKQILNFNGEKCRIVATELFDQYNKMMINSLSV